MGVSKYFLIFLPRFTTFSENYPLIILILMSFSKVSLFLTFSDRFTVIFLK